MRSEQDFREFFKREILPELRRLEERRKEARASLTGPAIWGTAIVAVIVAGLARDLTPLLAPFAVAFVRYAKVAARLRTDLKREVVGRIVRFCDPSLQYSPHGALPAEAIRASRVFEGVGYDSMSGEDYVAGRIGSTAIQLSELRLVEKRGKESRTTFSGLVLVADFPKSFHGRTLLLPDRAERALGALGRGLQSLRADRGTLVELEDPEFERHFAVYSTDPTEARYLLSPSLMQRLALFRQNSGAAVRASFSGGSLYLAVPLTQNLFEIPIDASLLTETAVRACMGELMFALGIVEDLDLNTRIWSKAPKAAAG